MRLALSILLIILCAEVRAAAPRELARAADSYLAAAIAEHRIPGAAAGIAIDGRIVWLGAAGLADVEEGRPVTDETPFRIASISKIMTAVAVLAAAERGLVDLDASVQTYLPDYPPPRKGTMTVLQLLSHRSGIRHSKGDESRESVRRYETLRDACRFFENRKLASAPGSKVRYSSYGYTVLGAILEEAAGVSFETWLERQVWTPAGMERTALDRRPADDGGAAALYRREGGRIAADIENDLSLIYPGGGMVSTAEDLLRLTIALEEGELLSAPSLARMLGDQPKSEGLGWNVWEHESHGRILSRVGGQSGTSALLVSYPDRGVTAVLLTNIARLDPIWTLINELIGLGLSARSAEGGEGSAGVME